MDRQFHSIEDILDFAIENEQEAIDLYTRLAETAKRSAIRRVFKEFTEEERKHKVLLEEFKGEKRDFKPAGEVLDLKISDYIVEDNLSADAGYQTILVYAMKKEKAAFRLYTNLAGQTEDPQAKALLQRLAHEEAKHKLYFEIEYDECILTEN